MDPEVKHTKYSLVLIVGYTVHQQHSEMGVILNTIHGE